MVNYKIFIVVFVVLTVLVAGFLILTNNKDSSDKNTNSQNATDINQMVDCGKMENPSCFMNRMSECLPVTAELIGNDNSNIKIIILGQENGTCHFQRKINDAINLNCYFQKGTLSWDTIDQTFGNDKGLQEVVDDACSQGW